MNELITHKELNKFNRTTPFLLLVFFSISITGWSQVQMNDGFSMLENQQYAEAEEFFEKVLTLEPENKTAKICLGRAKGLGGATRAAIQIFSQLYEVYPDDVEVILNLAEAHLWNHTPDEAVPMYNDVLKIQPNNTNALQGKANALSSQEKYGEAMEYIDRAVAIQPGSLQIQLSRKSTYLAQAHQLRQIGEIGPAHHLIDAVLSYFPNDEQALFDKATTYMYQQNYKAAKNMFTQLDEVSEQKVRIMSGLSYTSLLLNQKEGFLLYADSALLYQQVMSDTISFSLFENKARALTFNNSPGKAHALLDSLQTVYPERQSLKICKNQLLLWAGNGDQAVTGFQKLYQTDSLNTEITVGMAESLNAVGRKRSARNFAHLAAIHNPNNPDINRLAEKLHLEIRPTLMASYLYSSDKGGNSATELKSTLGSQLTDKMHASLSIGSRSVKNKNDQSELNRRTIGLNTLWQLNGSYTLRGNLQSDRIEIAEEKYTQNLSGLISLRWAPGKIHSFEGSLESTFLDYNPILLSQKIRANNYKLTYHMYLHNQIGMFNQLIITSQSDMNNRALYFGSLYYNLATYPVAQLAVNYTTFSYSLSRPEFYFSPDRFQSAELMFKLDNSPIHGCRLRYLLSIASGYQFIDQNAAQWTLRAEAQLNYKIDPRFTVHLNYLYSNSANSTAAGFTFNQVAFGLKAIF